MYVTYVTLGVFKQNLNQYKDTTTTSFLGSFNGKAIVSFGLIKSRTATRSIVAFRVFISMLRMSVNILSLFTSISENNC